MNHVDYHGLGIDFRHQGSYLVFPPSEHETGVSYEFLRGIVAAKELPFFPLDILEEPLPEPKICPALRHDVRKKMRGLIRSPFAYVMRISSVQGKNGSAALVRVVCVLRDSGISSTDAFEYLMKEWNPIKATPPWSEAEIIYCINRHYGVST